MNSICNTFSVVVLFLIMVLSGAGHADCGTHGPQDEEKVVAPGTSGGGGQSQPRLGAAPSVPPPTLPSQNQQKIREQSPSATQEVPVIAPNERLPGSDPSRLMPSEGVSIQSNDSGETTAETPPISSQTEEAAPVQKPEEQTDPTESEQNKLFRSPIEFLEKPTHITGEKPPETKPSSVKPKKPPPPIKEEPITQTPSKAEQTQPKLGAPMRIPPDAVKTGDLSFFEGCWKASRPAHPSERIINGRRTTGFLMELLKVRDAYAVCGTIIKEIFCFNKDGNGKRFIEDPRNAGTCVGAAQRSFDQQGRLIITSEQAYCDKGGRWELASMVCEGEGDATTCFWRFPDNVKGQKLEKIPLVRDRERK